MKFICVRAEVSPRNWYISNAKRVPYGAAESAKVCMIQTKTKVIARNAAKMKTTLKKKIKKNIKKKH
jgi:hypothetical protein